MQNPFTIYPRPVSASLNRVRVAALPAVIQDSNLVQKSGYDLLSKQVLLKRIQTRRLALALPAHLMDPFIAFDHCFSHNEYLVRLTAKQMAVQYGRCLAAVLLTLKEGQAANRAARPEWQDEHWAYWQAINQVWLGGGLMAGQFGQHALVEAQRLIAQAGYDDYQLALTPHPAHVTLMGAVATLPANTTRALLLDFGQSQVKRGLALMAEGKLQKLHLLRPLPAACGSLLPAGPDRERAAAQWQHIITVLALTWRQIRDAGWQPQRVVVAMACNLHQGHPGPDDWGCYGRLQELTPNLQNQLAEEWQQISGQAMPLLLLQDARAAALAHHGAQQAAVLTLGTAIGIGFPDDVVSHNP